MAYGILTAIRKNSAQNGEFMRFASAEDFLLYELPDGTNWAVVQLDSDVSWPSGAVITVRVSNTVAKQYDFPVSPVTYAALGVQEILEVTGCRFLRLQVTTEGGTTETVTPTVRVGRDA